MMDETQDPATHPALPAATTTAAALRPIDVGVVGALGDMGRLYAERWATDALSSARPAVAHVHVCDHPAREAELRTAFAGLVERGVVTVHADGHGVARAADLTMYSVESARVAAVVGEYARSTKRFGIVGGQTSSKAQELRAFEQHAPADVSIVSMHSMHGPAVDPAGQPLAVIPHRVVRTEDLAAVHRVLAPFGSRVLELSADQHDRMTADTQAVTHVAFLSMAAAWASVGVYPWASSVYRGNGVDEVKVMLAMRICFAKWHVYAGLAILNESAREQVRQFARSARELFGLMIQQREDEFRARVNAAAAAVFSSDRLREPILDLDRIANATAPPQDSRPVVKKSNSHLAILAIVDCWHQSGINPFHHLAVLGTPPFRLLLGIAQHVFVTPALLEDSVRTALYDLSIRNDDLHYVLAVAKWAEIICVGSFDAYREHFGSLREFFDGHEEMSREWVRRSNDAIAKLASLP
ncbi:prephenate dehydrogenase (NADP(+)) [Cladochytrium tenue]|nr:prephenate dehydrogenase (NADP(+)) [Cladochytrium tenue]